MNALKSPIKIVEEEHRTLVKRSELVARIRDMIVIVKNYEDEELLSHLPLATIPYYLVGLDDAMEQEIRSYFAEMIFVAALEYPGCDDQPMAGIRVGRLARMNENVTEWFLDAPRFSAAEREHIAEWCNPVYMGPEGIFCAWGNGAYVGGKWFDRVVTGSFIKQRIDFDPLRHMIVYDHN